MTTIGALALVSEAVPEARTGSATDDPRQSMLANEGGAATQDALSRRLFVDRSNAGRAFKRLEQAGHIGRHKDDADNRTNLADITPKGREAAAEVNRLGNEMARTFFDDLTEADAATVVTLLRKAL
jgi:DNA-binding MarR family transcriptional regulator